MVLEGVVTNVAAFGAFVDIGVHQDGLVHVSQLSHNFVKDPREVVKPGDIVRVKVLDVDIPRKRISLTLRLDEDARRRRQTAATRRPGGQRGGGQRGGGQKRRPARRWPAARGGQRQDSGGGGAMADALRKAGYRPK